MKNILVTGGLGHIGSLLLNKIQKQHNLTIVDDMLTQRYNSLFFLERKASFLDSDFDKISTEDLKKYDAVVHLAARTDAAGSMQDKDSTYDINVTRTKRLIDRCKQAEIKNFIFPSSTSVYGSNCEEMFEDDLHNLSPQSPYADSKIQIEQYLSDQKINHTIFRFGTIFGTSPGMRFHTAINKFCYQAALGQSLTVWKENYDQFRPYLGINDAIKAINMSIDDAIPKNQVYNVLTDNYKLSQIVELISQKIQVNVSFVNTPLLNQHTYFVNSDKIKRLGFVPSDTLGLEINETLKLFRNIKNI